MRSFFVLVLFGALLGTLALVVRSGLYARDNPGQPINRAMRLAMNKVAPQWSEDDAAVIAKKYPNAFQTASGLLYIVHAPGEGPMPAVGARVTVSYEGRFLDGMKFDSSYDRKEPITFTLGTGRVIKGWDEAFLGMRKGEKRTLIVPYWLAYGNSSRPPIPPRATLVFEVELVSFTP